MCNVMCVNAPLQKSHMSCVENDARQECTAIPHVQIPLLNMNIGACADSLLSTPGFESKLSCFLMADYRWIGLLFSGSDFVACVVFLAVAVFIKDRIQSVTAAVDGANVKASDYSVLVRGLPRNATMEEVLQHFNKLYDLGEEDWTFEGFRCWLGRKTHKRAPERTASRSAAKVVSSCPH